MFKWIILIFVVYAIVGVTVAYQSESTPISTQVDLKTMSLHNPQYITETQKICVGTCRNYSSSSSWGGGSSSGK